jgi:hypothetical protein
MIDSEDMIRILGCIPQGDSGQLDQIIQGVRLQRSHLQQTAKRAFKVGDRVTFLRHKSGVILHGVIQKINRKTIGVLTDTDGEWRVYPRSLSLES